MDKDNEFQYLPKVTDSYINPAPKSSQSTLRPKFRFPKYALSLIPVVVIMIGIMFNTYFIKLSQDIRSKAAGVCPTKAQGDANCDGAVNSTDLQVWKSEFTLGAQTKTADFDQDGSVNHQDFRTLISNLPNNQPMLQKRSSIPDANSACGWCGQECVSRKDLTNCSTDDILLDHREGYSCELNSSSNPPSCVKKLLDLDGVILN